MKMGKQTANIITLIRIAMIPIFMVLFLSFPPYAGTGSAIYWSLVVFVIASCTDKLDGYIARKYNQVSNFGKFVDPLADKLLVCAALILLSEYGYMAGWMVFVILAREFIVTSLRVVAMSCGRVLAANNTGKLKTVLQILGVCVLLIPFVRDISLWSGFAVGDACNWIITLFTAYSGVVYIWGNRDILKTSIENK